MGATAIKYASVKPISAFISDWDTTLMSTGSSASNQVTLPLYEGGIYDFSVSWGDGTSSRIRSFNAPDVTHTYAAGGVYRITIKDIINGFRFNYTGDRLKIKSVTQWGCFRPGNLGYVFYGCSNLNLATVTDVPNLKGVTTLAYMFAQCSSISRINRIEEWDISEVTDISSLFWQVAQFNQSLNNWDTSKVTDMSFTFQEATAFNQPLNNWDVSSCT